MSCIAPVVDATSSRLDFAATSSHTAPWSARAAMPVATRACAARFFIARSDGYAACGAGRNASPWRAPSQRPCSTQLTGTRRLRPAATSTDTSNVRFCCAPRTSSPSYSRTFTSVGLRTTRSPTEAPSSSSLTSRPRATPSANATYSATGGGPNSGNTASGPWTSGSPTRSGAARKSARVGRADSMADMRGSFRHLTGRGPPLRSDSPCAGRRGRAAPRTAAATQRTFAAERVPGETRSRAASA